MEHTINHGHYTTDQRFGLGGFGPGFGFGRPGFGFGRPGFGFGRPGFGFGGPFAFGVPFLTGLAAGALLAPPPPVFVYPPYVYPPFPYYY